MFGMRFLKISYPFYDVESGQRSLFRERAAMAVLQTIDQMHISGPATSRANCQFAREMRMCARFHENIYNQVRHSFTLSSLLLFGSSLSTGSKVEITGTVQ